MKVTANIPDDIIRDVKAYSQGKNITESLLIALKEWLSQKKLNKLNSEVKKDPLEFIESFTAEQIREINRK